MGSHSAATVSYIVRYNDAPATARRHAVIAVMIALVVLVIGTGSKLIEPSHQTHHGPHVLPSDAFCDFAVLAEHPHVQDGSACTAPDAFAQAPLPRTATLLFALGLVAIIGAAFSWWGTRAAAVIRGPPRWGGHHNAGQQLLLRLCIARR